MGAVTYVTGDTEIKERERYVLTRPLYGCCTRSCL